MSAGKTEDFLCIQDISVFLVTLQGFYCKLLLWFPVAVWAYRFGAFSSKSFETTGWRVQ